MILDITNLTNDGEIDIASDYCDTNHKHLPYVSICCPYRHIGASSLSSSYQPFGYSGFYMEYLSSNNVDIKSTSGLFRVSHSLVAKYSTLTSKSGTN